MVAAEVCQGVCDDNIDETITVDLNARFNPWTALDSIALARRMDGLQRQDPVACTPCAQPDSCRSSRVSGVVHSHCSPRRALLARGMQSLPAGLVTILEVRPGRKPGSS